MDSYGRFQSRSGHQFVNDSMNSADEGHPRGSDPVINKDSCKYLSQSH